VRAIPLLCRTAPWLHPFSLVPCHSLLFSSSPRVLPSENGSSSCAYIQRSVGRSEALDGTTTHPTPSSSPPQWSPENNINSRAGTVRPGEILYGNVTYLPESNSYKSVHTSSSGWSVSMTIPVQGKKNYTILYVVFEKAANCDQYPPEGKVLFTDIKLEYEGVAVTPTWTTGIVDDVCNNRAHIVNSTAVSITWDTNGANPSQELIEAHRRVGMQPRARAA